MACMACSCVRMRALTDVTDCASLPWRALLACMPGRPSGGSRATCTRMPMSLEIVLRQVVEEREAGNHHHHDHEHDHHGHEHDHHAEEPSSAAHAHEHAHEHAHAHDSEHGHAHSEHGHAHGHEGHDHSHKHDDSVTSVSLELDGFLDLDKVRRQIRQNPSQVPVCTVSLLHHSLGLYQYRKSSAHLQMFGVLGSLAGSRQVWSRAEVGR